MCNAGLDEGQAGIKVPRRNINNLRYAGDTTLMAESEEEPKSLLMKVKEESEKVGLIIKLDPCRIFQYACSAVDTPPTPAIANLVPYSR